MSVGSRISSLYLKKDFSDVRFIFTDQTDTEIPGHKLIIGTASDVLKDLVMSGDNIHITSFTPMIFKQFLRFIYTDNVSWNEESLFSLMALYQCAETYGVNGLKAQCQSKLIKVLNGTVDYAAVFTYSRKIQLTFVYDIILEKMRKDFESLVKQDSFLSLNGKELKIVVENGEDLNTDELALFKALDKWASGRCHAEGKCLTGEEKRILLGDIIYIVRIASIPLQQFSDEIVGSGILTTTEQLAFFKHYSGVFKFDNICGFQTSPRKNVRKKKTKCLY